MNHIRRIQTVFVVVALLAPALPGTAIKAAPAGDAHDPASELASFTVADGFEVNLFASEADGVVKPIQMRFDARGRLWVIGSTVYPQPEPGQRGEDKLVILEDTDRDGRCDKTTVFADDLMIPTGLELVEAGAYVGQGTQLLLLKDTDGDDKADVRKVVLRGFGTGDTHQTINSFAWGPGGELWMCQGLSIRSRVETPWGIVGLNNAGLWRFRPRRMRLEGFYGSQNEPQNPWGYVFTDWGEPIVIAGNNSSPIYPVPGLTSAHRDLPPALIWVNGGGRKCSGGDVVGTSHFPKDWQGALIKGGYINNAVWAVDIKDDGAGFRLEDRPQPLITSSDVNFRPVDVKFGPDGALYICDWYNPIIGHYQASLRDPRRDKTHGRIWRVTAKGRKLTEPPRLADATVTELLEHLKSKDRWTRHFAKRVLADRPKDEVVAALGQWTARPKLSELALKEALGVYQSHEVVEPALLERLCKARSRGARAYAAHVIGLWADRLEDPLSLLRPLVEDADPRVRLQAVVACSYVPKAEAVEVAAVAADHPSDGFLRYAMDQTVYALKPYWVGPFKTGELSFDNKPSRLGMLVRADGTPDTLQAVRELVASPALDPAARESFYHILAETGDSNDLATILQLGDAALKAKLLPSLVAAAELRGIAPSGDLAAAVRGMLSGDDQALRGGALSLAAAWRLQDLRGEIEAVAVDEAEAGPARAAAAKALAALAGPESRDTLLKLSAEPTPAPVRGAAVVALASVDMNAAAAQAATFLSGAVPDEDANELFLSLLRRSDAAPALAAAFQATPPSADAAKIGLRVMSATGQRDEALAAIFAKATGMSSEPKQLSEEEVAKLVAEVQAEGDAARGEQVFLRAELGCVACHAVNGMGGRTGPDLGNLGTAQPLEFIVGAILDPNREVKEGYISYTVATTRGETYNAYVVREDAQELVIRDLARDEEVRLRQDSIANRAQRGSVMPPGLADTLTRAEFRDLVKYLSSLDHAGPADGSDEGEEP